MLPPELWMCFFLFIKLPWKSESPTTSVSQLTIALKACICGSIRSKTDWRKHITNPIIFSIALFCYTNRKVLGEGKRRVIRERTFLVTPGHWFKKLLSSYTYYTFPLSKARHKSNQNHSVCIF